MTITLLYKNQRRVVPTLALLGLSVMGLLSRNATFAQDNGHLSTNIKDYVSSQLDDFSATLKVLQYDAEAGAKINRDFGTIYQLKGDVKVRYKEENKLRLDAHLKTLDITFIVNGTKQYVRSAIIKDTRDIGNEPGKRKTLLDVGLISEGYLSYSNAEFKGASNINGVPCAKFKFTYKDKSDSSHRIVWIDPKTKVTLKREDYSQLGKLNATFYYRDPKEIAPGVWFPSRIEAFNNEGQKAGETAYRDVKVNQGLEDSVFQP